MVMSKSAFAAAVVVFYSPDACLSEKESQWCETMESFHQANLGTFFTSPVFYRTFPLALSLYNTSKMEKNLALAKALDLSAQKR